MIDYEVAGGVARVTLNRPDKYNALNTAMTDDLKRAFKQAAQDKAVRAVLLTGEGAGFCSGQDLTEFQEVQNSGVSVGDHLRAGYNALVLQMRALDKPIVCAINGVAAGAGASLTLGADLRIAAQDASFVFGAFLGVGLVADTGATVFLPQIIGVARTFELLTLNDGKHRLSAQKAHDWGLANQLAAPGALLTEAAALTERLAALPTVAVGLTKRAVYGNIGRTLPEALEYEAQLQDIAARTADHQEGIRAFLEKRPPTFTGG